MHPVNDNTVMPTGYLNDSTTDNKLRAATGNNVKYFLANHLGSTNALTDSSGNITSSASYDSFGNATGNLNTRYQYTGREYDNFTGLHYYRARFYDSNLGRFISEDPIGFAGGDVNLYGYVANNPISKIDPFGETEEGMIDRLQYHQDPATREYVSKWNNCLSKCLLTYGIGEVLGFAGYTFGQPMISKSAVRPNETDATSPISKYLSEKFPQRLSRKIFPRGLWAPTGDPRDPKFWTRRTRSLGRVIGRWVPIISIGVLVGDFFWIRSCANECYEGKCSE